MAQRCPSQIQSFCVVPTSQSSTDKRQFGKEKTASRYFLTMCGGCGNLENAAHLFFHCNFLSKIWFVVYDWLVFVLVMPFNILNHLA